MEIEIKNLKLCSRNHAIYRQIDRLTNGQTDKVNLVHPNQILLGRGVMAQCSSSHIPDSKVHGANMEPIWGRQDLINENKNIPHLNITQWRHQQSKYFIYFTWNME